MGESTIRALFTWRSALCESDLPPATRHVALTLSLYMNERGGSAHPGAQRLSHETGLHIRTVQEKSASLESLGWLHCVERGGRQGEQRHANEYVAVIPGAVDNDLRSETTGGPERNDLRSSLQEPTVSDQTITPLNSPMNSRRNVPLLGEKPRQPVGRFPRETDDGKPPNADCPHCSGTNWREVKRDGVVPVVARCDHEVAE